MQYRAYDRQTLSYQDGGAVREYSIDGDYINDNNSVIGLVTATTANIGDIICLIETSGAYDKGVITAVDNEALTISYKHDKELFNDNILNPLAAEFLDDTDIKAVGKFGLSIVGELIELYWGNTLDTYKRLPLKITYSGDVLDDSGNAKMLWTWSNTQIKFGEWLVELFQKYSVVLSWDIDFDTAQTDVMLRKPYYIVHLSAVNNNTEMIKDNVDTQTIKYQTEQQPEATACIVVDKETKDIMYISSGVNILDTTYGYTDCYLDNNGVRRSVMDIMATQPQNSIVSGYTKVNASTEYTLSMEEGDSIPRQICFYNNQKTCIGALENGYTGQAARFSQTFTTPENTKFVRVCFAGTAKNIQLEVGSSATDYDPYNKPAIYYLAFNSETRVYDGYYAPAGTVFYSSSSAEYPMATAESPVNVIKRTSNNNTYFITEDNTAIDVGDQYVSEYSSGIAVSVHSTPTSTSDMKAYKLKNGTWTEATFVYSAEQHAVLIVDIGNGDQYKVVYKPQNGIFTPYFVYFKAEDIKYNGYYTTMDASDSNRIMPVKTKYVEYDSESDSDTTVEDTAINELTPSSFNHAIEIEIPYDTKMFDFELANYGDVYRIITKNGTIRSVYSGRKESSSNKMVTLLFGLGRKNYTDLIQKGFRTQKYQTLYR